MLNQEQLIEQAKEVMKKAYTPYSKFNVGCAILLKDGSIVKGANIENASYGLTNCAERSALYAAYSEGYRDEDIEAMAIVGDTDTFISPCGACRQVISELVNDETAIILTNLHDDTHVTNREGLLPFGFSKKDLNEDA